MRSNLGRSNAKHQCAGVYVAGDITPNSQLAIVATAEGEMASIHVYQWLIPKDRRF
jgi:thioredoxin reductase